MPVLSLRCNYWLFLCLHHWLFLSRSSPWRAFLRGAAAPRTLNDRYWYHSRSGISCRGLTLSPALDRPTTQRRARIGRSRFASRRFKKVSRLRVPHQLTIINHLAPYPLVCIHSRQRPSAAIRSARPSRRPSLYLFLLVSTLLSEPLASAAGKDDRAMRPSYRAALIYNWHLLNVSLRSGVPHAVWIVLTKALCAVLWGSRYAADAFNSVFLSRRGVADV